MADYQEPAEDYEDRIVGGQDAIPNSIPWQVQVKGNCGGTIVTQKLGMVQKFEIQLFQLPDKT